MGDVEARLAVIESNQEAFKGAVVGIEKNLEKLVRLEERHAETKEAISRAFTYMEKIEGRLEQIEMQMPGLVETRGWIIKACMGTLGVVGLAVLGIAIIK